jgi:outer membrane protein assembly factor BamB
MNREDMKTALSSLVLWTSLVTPVIADPSTGNWPQWRGPTRDAKVEGSPSWPRSLSTIKERWRVELGPSYSGPVVWGDRVFVTETANEEREIVRALDRKKGKELWSASWSGAISVPFFAKSNGDWIRSTPACDGESLFVGGMRDVLVSLDVATGAERWRFDFPGRLGAPVPAFGFVSSPLVAGEFVYVQAGGAFVKLNKKTGELIW